MHPQSRRLTLAGLLPAALCLAGCMHAENDRLRLGACETLPVFQTQPHALPPAGTSVSGLDRSEWAPVAFVVPVHGTAHQPTYAPSAFELADLPRQRGEFPTPESALDLGEPSLGTEVVQAARTHGLAALDALLLVPRLLLRPPTATDWSPRQSYERATEAVRWAPSPCGHSAPGRCESEPAEPDACCPVVPAEAATPAAEAEAPAE